jgi:hypothetical protein
MVPASKVGVGAVAWVSTVEDPPPPQALKITVATAEVTAEIEKRFVIKKVLLKNIADKSGSHKYLFSQVSAIELWKMRRMNDQTPVTPDHPARPTCLMGIVQGMVVSDLEEKSVAYWMDQPADDAITAFRQIMRQRRGAANRQQAES